MMNCPCDSNNMKYGQIAGSKRVNALIYRCFEYVCEQDQRKFVKKFHTHDSDQVMHTLRELVLGAYLSSGGLQVRHEYAVDSKTPDWSILDEKSMVIGIVELTSFHIDKATENEIEQQLQARGEAWVWRDQKKDNVERLYHRIWKKADEYSALVERLRVPYVVGIFPELQAAVDYQEELCPCLFDKGSGLFEMCRQVSGVLYFEEFAGRWSFKYAPNPNPLQKFDLPSGVFPPEAA